MVNSAFFFLVTVCLFVILFVVGCFCHSVCSFLTLFVCLSAVSVCLCLFAFLFPCLSVSVCHCLFAFLISVSVCIFVCLSVCLFVSLFVFAYLQRVCLPVCMAVVTVGGLVATFKDGYARSLCTSVHMVMNISCSCYVCFPLSNRQFVRLCLFTTCLSQ